VHHAVTRDASAVASAAQLGTSGRLSAPHGKMLKPASAYLSATSRFVWRALMMTLLEDGEAPERRRHPAKSSRSLREEGLRQACASPMKSLLMTLVRPDHSSAIAPSPRASGSGSFFETMWARARISGSVICLWDWDDALRVEPNLDCGAPVEGGSGELARRRALPPVPPH